VAANFTTFIDAGDEVEMSQEMCAGSDDLDIALSFLTMRRFMEIESPCRLANRRRVLVVSSSSTNVVAHCKRASNGISGGGGGGGGGSGGGGGDRPFSSLCLRSGVQARI